MRRTIVLHEYFDPGFAAGGAFVGPGDSAHQHFSDHALLAGLSYRLAE